MSALTTEAFRLLQDAEKAIANRRVKTTRAIPVLEWVQDAIIPLLPPESEERATRLIGSPNWSWTGKVYLDIHLFGLEGFKAPELLRILEVFTLADEWVAEETQDITRGGSLCWVYKFKTPLPIIPEADDSTTAWFEFNRYAGVRSDSPTCHKVLVESRVMAVDQSVYRIVCE